MGSRAKPMASGRAGLTLVEITISLLILMALLMSSVTAFSSSLRAGAQATRLTKGVFYLETLTENLSALSHAEVLALNGNRIFDVNDASDSNYGADITVFPVGVDQVQVRLVLIDLRTGAELGRVSNKRSDW